MTNQLKHSVEDMKSDAQIDPEAHQGMELLLCALCMLMDLLKECSHGMIAVNKFVAC